MQQIVSFSSGQVKYIYDGYFEALADLCGQQYFIITDAHVAEIYPTLVNEENIIVLPAGESSKDMATLSGIAEKLIALEATRQHMLVGVGGGVVTDITGFMAHIYMRGLPFGFVPTTLLGMVDASIGGKNGVNLGLHKNIMGTIAQPSFILFDMHFLITLPAEEWSNGFAEIIKYACIFDKEMFEELARNDISYYRNSTSALRSLIERCAGWKNKTVIEDEREKGVRKLLNFGHTAGHAIETLYKLPHGQAVAIGMMIAATISEQVTGFAPAEKNRLKDMLLRYQLPVLYKIDVAQTMELLKMDKKRRNDQVDYILLRDVGEAIIKPLSFEVIEKALMSCAQ